MASHRPILKPAGQCCMTGSPPVVSGTWTGLIADKCWKLRADTVALPEFSATWTGSAPRFRTAEEDEYFLSCKVIWFVPFTHQGLLGVFFGCFFECCSPARSIGSSIHASCSFVVVFQNIYVFFVLTCKVSWFVPCHASSKVKSSSRECEWSGMGMQACKKLKPNGQSFR
jgi:hypothetical protein